MTDLLREAVRGLLAKQSDVRAAMASPRGYDEALWARLCGEIGVAALAIPECYGGFGAGMAETHVVLEELGRTLTPAPLLGSAVLGAQALLASGNDEACRRLLPGIAAGTSLAALVWAWDASAVKGTFAALSAAKVPLTALTSTHHYVLDGDLADVLLVAAQDGQLYEVDPNQPGVERTHTPAMDPTRRLATVRLDSATGRRLGPANLPHIRDIACAALSAEQVGAAARCLELTVEYTKTRVQFGRPIAAFQALQHRMADLYVLVETARSASYAANDPISSAVAKVYCSEAFCRVAGEMIQLHGGIAITWEHDAHLYFKRAHGSSQLFGSPRHTVARLTEFIA